MSLSQKEKVLREKRTIEATKKNMMGPAGKLGIIARYLGNPIMKESSVYVDTNFLEDPYEDFSDIEYEKTLSGQNGPVAYRDELPTSDMGAGSPNDDNPNFLGYVFDGLNRGFHIEIQMNRSDHTLTTYYKGYQVYRENAGELEAYNPFPDWEDLISKLYETAKQKIKRVKLEEYQELAEIVEKKKDSFWQKLRMRWGI